MNWHVTQISNKQQCLSVGAVNGLKKEQLELTDGAENRLSTSPTSIKTLFALI